MQGRSESPRRRPRRLWRFRHGSTLAHVLLDPISSGGAYVHVDDLDISPSKIAETAQRIIDRAIEEARRREHALLTNEHIFLAFAQVEWDMFAEVMRDVDLNPQRFLKPTKDNSNILRPFPGRSLPVSPP